MPRIPEGNFKSEPTSRVARQSFVPVKSNSRALREFGGKAQKIGEQIEKAEVRAESLAIAKKSDESWGKEEERLDNLFNMTDNGIIKKGTNLGNGQVADQDTKFSDYTDNSINSWQDRMTAEVGSSTNPEALDMHNRYTANAVSDYSARAKVNTDNKIVNGTVNSLKSELSVLEQNYINGDATDEELALAHQKVIDSSEIVGLDTSNKLLSNSTRSLAMNTHNMILNREDGGSVQNIAEVNRRIAGIQDAGLRTIAQSNVKKAIEQKEQLDFNKGEREYAKTLTSVKSPQDAATVAPQIVETLNNLKNNPIPKLDTLDGVIRKFSGMQGKMSAMTLLGSPIAETDGKVTSLAKLASNDARIGVAVEEEVDRISRDIASSAMSKFEGFDMESTKNQLRQQISGEISAVYKEREENFVGHLKKFEPGLMRKVASGKNPDDNVALMFEMYKTAGLPTDEFNINDAEDIKNDGKIMKQLRESGDTDGATYTKMLQQQQARYGKSAGQAISESAGKGGLAPSMIYAVDAEPDFANRIASAAGSFSDNMKNLVNSQVIMGGAQSDDSDKFVTEKSGETRLYNMVKKSMADNNVSVTALYYGGNNGARAQGYMDSVAFIAAEKAAGGVDIDKAIKSTIEEMNEAFPMVSDGNNMVTVSRAYANEYNMDVTKLPDTLAKARKMEVFEGLGYKLDIDRMVKNAEGNPNLKDKLTAIKIRGGKMEDFQDEFGDTLLAIPDRRDSNNIKLYTKDPKTSKITPIPVKKDGKATEALSVPVHIFHNKIEFLDSKSGFLRSKEGSSYGGTD